MRLNLRPAASLTLTALLTVSIRLAGNNKEKRSRFDRRPQRVSGRSISIRLKKRSLSANSLAQQVERSVQDH